LLRPLDERTDSEGTSDSAEELSGAESEGEALDAAKLKKFNAARSTAEKVVGVSLPKGDPPTNKALDEALKKVTELLDTHAKKVNEAKSVKARSSADEWLAGFTPGAKATPGSKTASRSSKRDSLDSTASETENGGGADSWGATSVDPGRFKASLSRLVKTGLQKQLRFGSGDPHNGYLGLFFLENATHFGERSLDLWLGEVEDELKANNKGIAVRSREVFELRFRVFETMRCLRSASCVDGALSGSDLTLEIMGRRLFTLSEVLAGNMDWSVADLYLPVGSVKSASYAVPAGKLKQLGRNICHGHRTRKAFKGVFTAKDKEKTGSV
jgi:hypothetical protein